MANLVEYEGKKVSCPETWNELDREQFLTICENWPTTMMIKDEENLEKSYYRAKVIILRSLIRMKPALYAHVTVDQIVSMFWLMDFLKEAPDLDKQLLPSFSIGTKTYYGPEAKLKRSTFDEFINADTLFMAIANGQFHLLDKLVATLYRPKLSIFQIDELKRKNEYNGDNRVPFNDETVADLAKYFKKRLPKKYKWAVFYFYWGFRNKNVIVFENLFKKIEKDQTKAKKEGNDYGWAGSLLELSGDKFGDFKDTARTNWFTIFVEMSRRSDIRREQIRKHQEAENKRRNQTKSPKRSRRR